MSDENLEIEAIDDPETEITESTEETSEASFSGNETTGDDDGDDESLEGRRRKGQKERLSRSQRQRNARVKKDEQLESLRRELDEIKSREAVTLAEQSRLHQMAANFQAQAASEKIKESKNLIDYWQKELANAMAAGDSGKLLQLQTAISSEQANMNEMEQLRNGYNSAAQQIDPARQLQEQQRLNHQNRWLSKNSWFNDPSYKEEKEIAEQLDREVLAAGYNAATPAYWQELNRRVKNSEIGYVLDDDEVATSTKKQPPTQQRTQRQVVGAGGASAQPSGSSKTMKFTSTQLQALRHQGIVDQNNKPVKGKEDDLKYYHNYWQSSKK